MFFDKTKNEMRIDGAILDGMAKNGESFSPEMLRNSLENVEGDLTVKINSGGGDVFAGVAIYNALKEHGGKVKIIVDGLAASIASVIAMAGDEIVMSKGSMMMIHKPWSGAEGNSKELKKLAETLDKIEESILNIYESRTGKSRAELAEMLEAETWLTADEAVALGFADSVDEGRESVGVAFAKMRESVAFAMKASDEAFEKKTKEDEKSDVDESVEDVEETEGEERPEETENVEDDEVETVEVVEEAESDETETEQVEDEEETAEKEEEKKKEKEEMEEIKNSIQQPVHASTNAGDVKAYLKSKTAMNDFANMLEKHAGEGAQAVQNAWKKHLEVKNGITSGAEYLLPNALISEIQDAFEQGGELWNRVTKVGANVWRAAWDAAQDVEDEKGRAKGHARGKAKAEQEVAIESRILRPQYVYKYITLDREDVANTRDTGALVKFVLAELPRRIVRELERAIVLGDGRENTDDNKIKAGNPQGFYNVIDDAKTGVFASEYTRTASEDNYSAVLRASDTIKAEGKRVLIAKRGFITDMKLSQSANGAYLFPAGADIESAIGVDVAITPDWFNDTTADGIDAIIMVPEHYRTVGDTAIEAFQNFALGSNKHEYLQEIFVGGGLTVKKSAVVIKANS